MRWAENWLKGRARRVVVGGAESSWRPVAQCPPEVSTGSSLYCEGDSWNRLPKEGAQSPSPGIFKTCPDAILCNVLWVTLLEQEGWTR